MEPRALDRELAGHPAVRGLDRIGGFGGKSDILARGQVFTGNPEQYLISLERVRKATAEDLRDAARRWLGDGLYQLQVVPYPEYKAAATGADRSKLPEVGAMPNVKLPPFERLTLSNGLKVVLAERHELPLVNFTMLVDAGTSADSPAAPGSASAANVAMAAPRLWPPTFRLPPTAQSSSPRPHTE